MKGGTCSPCGSQLATTITLKKKKRKKEKDIHGYPDTRSYPEFCFSFAMNFA
jgi:hypothetical protein